MASEAATKPVAADLVKSMDSLQIPSSSNSNSPLSLDERYDLIRGIAEECDHCIGEEELRSLLAQNAEPICYDGFEPSGRMHIAQGILKAINVRKMIAGGCRVKIWIADWFAMLNNKLGGDMKNIETVGRYFIEIWRSLGMELDSGKVEFLWASKEINARADEYWPLVMDIATKFNLSDITGCSEIMGRKRIDKKDSTDKKPKEPNKKKCDTESEEELYAAQILYVCMQCADIFFLQADICQMGMDQCEVNVLAQEYCDKIEKKKKPTILSHHVLPGLQLPDLQPGAEKMSKSDLSSIFMEDEEVEVNRKIKKAYCPPETVEGNPCLEYIKYLILPWFHEFTVERSEKHGGNRTFTTFDELGAAYEKGEVHPGDLKPSLAKALNKILEPVRLHFKNDKSARKLLQDVKSIMAAEASGQGQSRSKLKSISHSPSQDQPQNSPNLTVPLSLDERYELISGIAEECIQEEELRNLLTHNAESIWYDGFEPSGRMHIAQGVLKAINVNKMTVAGCRVKLWIADWFALLNNKMGGNLEKIETLGRYFIEIWRSIGMDLDSGKVEFLWSSKEINARAHEYWPLVMDIATKFKLPRIKRCCTIMGRSDESELTAAQILYPCMQCADIFFLQADICQMGMDQRKVNMVAREYCDEIKNKNKPIILSHHMLPGLLEGKGKMSKSDPSSSIFMEDEEAEVNMKIEKAYCPPEKVEENPCLEYVKYLILPWFHEFTVERSEKHGGNRTFTTFDELGAAYVKGEVHPGDLKPSLAKALNKILEPVRSHFRNDKSALQLLQLVKKYNEEEEKKKKEEAAKKLEEERKKKEEETIVIAL